MPQTACAESAQERIHCSCDFLDAPPAVEMPVALDEVLGSGVFLHIVFFSMRFAVETVQAVPEALPVEPGEVEDCRVHVC